MTGTSSFALHGERVLLAAAALALSLAIGAFTATANFTWVLAALGVLAAAALVFSQHATFWFVVLTGLVAVGVCQMYVPAARALRYLPPLAAMGLLLHVAAHWVKRPFHEVPATVTLFLAFLGVSLVSMAANWSSFGMAVVGLKSYYPMWLVFLALALLPWRPGTLDAIPRVAVALALLQLPFVAHQFLYLVPMREALPDVVAVDIVAGTFGGDKYGGGANAVLSVFLITVTACLLGMWRTGAVKVTTMILGVPLLLLPVFLNSSRIALIYLPIVFCVVFSSQIWRHPLRAVVAGLVTAGLVMGLLTTYTLLSHKPGTTATWQGLIEATYENQFASERERAGGYSGLSRWTVLLFWVDQQKRGSLVKTMIGHGPGASRVQEEGRLKLAETLAETRYGGRQIGYTAVAALLWEVGVVGLMIMLLLFWAGFKQAGTLARYYGDRDPARAGIAHGLRAAMVIMVISLAHKDFLAFHVPYQTFLATMFGYLAAQINLMRADAWHAGYPVAGKVAYG